MCLRKPAKIPPLPRQQSESERNQFATNRELNRNKFREGREKTVTNPLGDSNFGSNVQSAAAGTVLGGTKNRSAANGGMNRSDR